MEKGNDQVSESIRRKYRLINQQFIPYGLLLIALLAVMICMLLQTVRAGRHGESLVLMFIFGVGYFSCLCVFVGRWIEARKKVRLQNTMDNLAQTAPTRRLDDVTPTGQNKLKPDVKTPSGGKPK